MQNQKTRQRLRFILRVLVIWAIEVIALLLMSLILPGLYIRGLGAAILAVAAIGLFNALLWPLLSYYLLPFAVFTLGLFSLVLNGLLVQLASIFVNGFHVQDLWTAIGVSLGIAAINLILSSLLTIDDDNSWYRNVVRRRIKRVVKPEETDVPGILFLEIDGLAEPVLEKAVREGHMPTLARWLESGSHHLVGWECDTSSQTSASQAGILHGNNHNIPAFRWYDRATGEIVASSNPTILTSLEQELSDKNGLLVDSGVSRGNMFSGDAPSVMYTASSITDLSRLRTGDFYAFFVNPYNFSRGLMLFIWDIILEKYQFWQARRQDVHPRLDRDKRGGTYPVVRAMTNIFMRELNIYTLIGDMFAGAPSGYATFVGYDEVAHHSGVESEDAFDVLRKLDQQFSRLESAARQAPRPYHFVILSDHGQSGGATFKQRYHMTLEEFVQSLVAHDLTVHGSEGTNEDWGHINVFLTDTIENERGSVAGPLRRIFGKQTHDGNVALGPEGEQLREQIDPSEELKDKIVVLASGNLGLIYFTPWKERMSREQIDETFHNLIPDLVRHEGVGFVMVNSEKYGPLAIGAEGTYYLADDRIEGENPLANFGSNAAQHLRRTNSFADAPDILVNSFYRPANNEVAAYEEQIGCHGGMGGYQSQPFVLYPAELPAPDAPLVGAASVYALFKAWVKSFVLEETPVTVPAAD
jgi:uncharacterized membrane protein YvlD (DUF360 family)